MGQKKIYFVSDIHLGMHPREDSIKREKLFVKWLDEIKDHASALYLLGDIFDYWFEYKKVVPRGFTRTLGKLAEINDKGVKIHYFTGNHDVWIFDYLPSEIGIILYPEPLSTVINNKKFYLSHGDGLGPGDPGFKLLKAAFRNRILQWFYARIHPNFTISLAHYWSRKSRYGKTEADEFKGEEKEL
ncbi:MAG: UDP-2,3-diacylglucosamine diphosphatase, partial [Bacteroidota bacterium]